MTQKTLAEQVAEMQNNLIALDKLLHAQEPTPQPQPALVGRIVVEYDDGTEQIFVPHKVTETPKSTMTAEEVLKIIRKRHVEPELAADPLPRKPRQPRIGFACIINGVKYNSIVHASRVLGMCRHTIKANLDRDFANWSYVNV
jgi:hypothetical protein